MSKTETLKCVVHIEIFFFLSFLCIIKTNFRVLCVYVGTSNTSDTTAAAAASDTTLGCMLYFSARHKKLVGKVFVHSIKVFFFVYDYEG